MNLASNNTREKVKFRRSILNLQGNITSLVESGKLKPSQCVTTHTFSPKSDEFGCYTYARQLFIPKGTLVVGKIHRHNCINIVIKGKIVVSIEDGLKIIEGPYTFVSEAGVKRAGLALEDTIWVTVHTTKLVGEENITQIENELTVTDYADLGLIDDVTKLLVEC